MQLGGLRYDVRIPGGRGKEPTVRVPFLNHPKNVTCAGRVLGYLATVAMTRAQSAWLKSVCSPENVASVAKFRTRAVARVSPCPAHLSAVISHIT